MFAELEVQTPEGITFKHHLAGVGSRCLATAIDILIFVAVSIILNILIGLLLAAMIQVGLSIEDSFGIVASFFILFNFSLLFGYRIVCETFKAGSVGYKVMGLTIVTYRGSKPVFWQAAVRGLLWPFECLFFALISFVSILITQRHQRLADLATGTMVVHRNSDLLMGTLRVQDAALDPHVPFRKWELSQVSDDEIYLIRRFLDRRVRLTPQIRMMIANQLYTMIWSKTSGIPTDWYAEAVLEGVAASRAVANERN